MDIDDYKSIPALRDYLARLADEHGMEIDQRNFRRWALRRNAGHYKKDYIIITASAAGDIISPAGYAPTAKEAKAIKAAWAKLQLPQSVSVPIAVANAQRQALGCDPANWFAIFDAARGAVVMCQQRIDKPNLKKDYIPWTFWDDKKWRPMEPAATLPLWKPALPAHPRERNDYVLYKKDQRLMIHEGAKSAHHVDWMINSTDPEASALRARHPWAVELAKYEHWGWLGGAPNPYRPDWSEVLRANPNEVVVVADNDAAGKQAVTAIARALQSLPCAVMVLMFDDSFPDRFDLAESFPAAFWVNDRYRGPRMADCWRPATWATCVIPTERKGAPAHVLREAFMNQWVNVILPQVFVNRRNPGRLLREEEFNNVVRPFSDVKDTADILKKEFVTQVDGIAYEPGLNQGVVTVEGHRCINTWTPTRVTRHKGGDVTPWLEFMEHLFPVEADRLHMLRWCATLIACVAVKMKYGILLISEEQGVGKGTLMEKILAPLVGWHNVSVPSEKTIVDSDYNSWIVRKRLVIVHEIYMGHSKKAYDSIKSKVSEDKIDAHEKYLKEYTINIKVHFVLSSNSMLALRLVKNDRRWAIPEVTERKKPKEYWDTLNAWLVSGGLEAIHDWAYE